jgi:hypothetical protein
MVQLSIAYNLDFWTLNFVLGTFNCSDHAEKLEHPGYHIITKNIIKILLVIARYDCFWN